MTLREFGEVSEVLSGIPDGLRTPLITEYNKIVRNFREERWEPAALNGGKFAEIAYTILSGYAEGRFAASPSKPRNMVDACRKLEHATSVPRSVRIQIPRVLIALYEIRNNRSIGHVGGDVDPNQMDANLVLAMARWTMAELVRIFHDTTIAAASQAVELLTERVMPLLWDVAGTTRVLAPKMSARDKALVVLYGKGSTLDVGHLAKCVEYGNVSRFRSKVLGDAHKEALLHMDGAKDSVTISPLGVALVEDELWARF